MNYYFTGALIILFVLLCFIKPAYPRNEYLNNGTNTCSTGDVSVSIEQRDSESRRSEERRVGKECRSRWSPDH